MSRSIDKWLADHGLEVLSATMGAHDIDLDILEELSDQDLAELGISLGNRKRLLKALAKKSEAQEPGSVGRGAPAPLSERRQVTILFSDIVGFTSISDHLDPEETHRLLSRYFEVADRVVTEFGGSIDKHIGDAVMAVFGAPKSHGNDAERAVRAAHAIHKAIAMLKPPLETHIGVAGGEVLASLTGSQDHIEYTVTGPSVNLASRLQGIANAGETLISEDVFNALASFAQCESRGEIEVKGLSRPARVWCLKSIRDKRDISGDRIFVGRQNELRQAFAILDGMKKHGRGAVLYVRGEAGIGKTRFADELQKHARALELNCHTGLILDFGVGQGEDLVTQTIRSLVSVPSRTEITHFASVVDNLVEQSAISKADQVHAFALLAAPQPPDLKPLFDAMDNEARKSGRLRVIASILQHVARASPVLLRVEDVHWADEPTLEALATFAAETVEQPIVLVMTSRFEGDKIDHNWRANARDCGLTIFDLGPLRKDDARDLVSNYLNTTDSFALRCIDRAAGNPLFLEQLLRSKESEAVPGSVQSLVQARLDQLGKADGEALRAASVLGQRFSLAAVRFMMHSPNYSCSQLIAQHLVRPEGEDYLFAHALVRDGIYQSIVGDRRKELHRMAAHWFADRDVMLHAWHLGLAGDESAPVAYLAAARAQAEAHRTESAIELCRNGLAFSPDRTTRFALLLLLGETQLEANESAASIETFHEAAKISEESGEKVRALIGLAAGMRLVDRLNDAEECINGAIELARKDINHALLAKAYFVRGNLQFPKSNYGQCIENHQASLEHARAAGSIELEVQALGGLGDAYYLRGHMQTAERHFALCVKGANESSLARVSAANRPLVAWCNFYNGKLNECWKLAKEAREEARSISHARAEIIALNALMLVGAERGDVSSILENAEAAMKLAQELGSHRFQAMVLLGQSWAHSIAGDRNKAAECLGKSLDLASETLSFLGPWIMGGLASVANSFDERRLWIDRGMEALQRESMSHNYLFFHSEVINVYLTEGNWEGARQHAGMLAQYTVDEPLSWSSFMVDRARWAVGMAEKESDENLSLIGKQLCQRGRDMGLVRSLAIFDDLRLCRPM
jgi:class 3 adenylate cyclase/tetratricopeptide (TPR) repeat protein